MFIWFLVSLSVCLLVAIRNELLVCRPMGGLSFRKSSLIMVTLAANFSRSRFCFLAIFYSLICLLVL